MPGQPVFRAFCKHVDSLGGEEYVFGMVVDGVAVRRIMERLELPGHGVLSRWMFYKWLDAEEGRKGRYREAQRLSADAHAETSGQILDELAERPVSPDSAEVSLARERSKYRQWLAEVRNREDYGGRTEAGTVINIGSLHLDALRRHGRAALADGRGPEVIEAVDAELVTDEAGEDPVLELMEA